ncbi:MAG: hypothetical protein VX583_05480 [Bdellovibrionota bacterium]
MKASKIIFLFFFIAFGQTSFASDPCENLNRFVTSFNENSGLKLEILCENQAESHLFWTTWDLVIHKSSINGIEACNSETKAIKLKESVISFYPNYVLRLFQHLNNKLEVPITGTIKDRDKVGAKAFYNFKIPKCFLD